MADMTVEDIKAVATEVALAAVAAVVEVSKETAVDSKVAEADLAIVVAEVASAAVVAVVVVIKADSRKTSQCPKQ